MADDIKRKQNMDEDHRDPSRPGRIATSRFSLGASIHARQAITRRAARFWMAVALPIAVLVIGGLAYDTRMLFIAAAVMFIMFPTLLLIGWYGILSRPWAMASLFPQVVTLDTDNEISVEYAPREGAGTVPPADLVIPSASVTDCLLWGKYVIVCYGNRRELIIPLSAFPSQESAADFLRRLQTSSRNHP